MPTAGRPAKQARREAITAAPSMAAQDAQSGAPRSDRIVIAILATMAACACISALVVVLHGDAGVRSPVVIAAAAGLLLGLLLLRVIAILAASLVTTASIIVVGLANAWAALAIVLSTLASLFVLQIAYLFGLFVGSAWLQRKASMHPRRRLVPSAQGALNEKLAVQTVGDERKLFGLLAVGFGVLIYLACAVAAARGGNRLTSPTWWLVVLPVALAHAAAGFLGVGGGAAVQAKHWAHAGVYAALGVVMTGLAVVAASAAVSKLPLPSGSIALPLVLLCVWAGVVSLGLAMQHSSRTRVARETRKGPEWFLDRKQS